MSAADSAHLPGPIRIGLHEWIIVRDNPCFPKALIRRIDPGGQYEHYRVVTFDLDPVCRLLVGRFRSLEAANGSVFYDPPPHLGPGWPPNMRHPSG